MNVLLTYPPFCTPASPPHSLISLYGFLQRNLSNGHHLELLDLNLLFHNLKWKTEGNYFRSFTKNYDAETYEQISREYMKESTLTYAANNKQVLAGESPEFFDELVTTILQKKPDLVALSIVYSSQAFYSSALLKRLNEQGIKTVVGGPSANKKLKELAALPLQNEVELLEYLMGKSKDHAALQIHGPLDFRLLPLSEYFVPQVVLPLRTSISCYYQQCTFCTHHGNKPYQELSLEEVKQTILLSKSHHVFFMDDMISRNRLLEIAALLKPLQVSWMCQLRPTRELDKKTLSILQESGLRTIMWGMESGSDRILQLMKKGTTRADAEVVLQNSAAAGIKNCLFILFGFPTETREDFKATLNFLQQNKGITALVLSTVFGLQQGAPLMNNLAEYGITMEKHERTLLEPKITYTVQEGLSQEQATTLRKRQKHFLAGMNHYPQAMNFFREHLLILLSYQNNKS